jgi:CRISPR-associated protein Cas2
VSAHEPKTWLVCYDIREPGRLRRVHRQLRKVGATVQYSAFSVVASDTQLARLLMHLRHLIADHSDDLRAYHLPERCPVWTLGSQHLPDGVEVDAASAAALLLRTAEPADHGP